MKRVSSGNRDTGKSGHRGWRIFFLVVLAVLVSPFLLVLYVVAAAVPHSYIDAGEAPAEPVALVFGAGITPNRNLTPMLADRVKTAVDLYQEHRVKQLLMTGDGTRSSHDEVTPMQRYASARGVARQDILLDYAGISTYDSCYRARFVFGVRRAVLVTQRYHLPRALYTCRALGIDAIGVGTPDWGMYSDSLMTSYTIREAGAILKALWEVHIAHPLPMFMSPKAGWRNGGS